MLALEGVREVIVVVDGSADDTAEVLASHDDPSLRVIALETNRGQPHARNAGVAASSGAWVLFAEDDCRFPVDYALTLRREAIAHGVPIVGAPFVYPRQTGTVEEEIARGRANPVSRVAMDTVTRFPAAATRTPFVPATALIRRDVFDAVRFDEGYGGNSFREETAFFVEAAQHGFDCLLTPETAAYQLEHWSGGARQPRLRYEYSTLRNNWRFLRRHGAWLAAQGYIRSPSLAQLALLNRRVAVLGSGFVQTHVLRRE